MLRQGMMGSDISYEDMMRNEDLFSRYTAVYDRRDEYRRDKML